MMCSKSLKQKSSDHGYATVMVTGLLSLLSIFVMLTFNGAQVQAQKARALTTQIETDLLLESVLNQFIAALVTGGERVHDDGLITAYDVSGRLVKIELRFDSERLSINSVPPDEVEAAIMRRLGAEPWAIQIAQQVSNQRKKDDRFSREAYYALLSDIGLSHENCVRAKLSPFEPGVVMPEIRSNEGAMIHDGSVIRIVLTTHRESTIRWLEVTGIVTGRTDDPFWIMDWRRGSGTPECAYKGAL